MNNKIEQAFFDLVKGGLWEKNIQLSSYGSLDYSEIYRMAEEQSVVGLITAGLEHVVDVKVPKEIVLQFVGQTLQIEQQNTAMNEFISVLVDKLRTSGIYTLLVKGQSVALCYERPLWRACGDVDLFLSDDNYEKAKKLLMQSATSIEVENPYTKHVGMRIKKWEVELHGNLKGNFSIKVDRMLDELKNDTFFSGNVRSWNNGGTQVFLLSTENDVTYVFTHILQHFFKGGIGLRQICDWCRLLWTYRSVLNQEKIKKWINDAGLMSEWKAFGALAVDYLGVPDDAMPFYDSSIKWKKKAKRIITRVLRAGNFGHNIDESYRNNESFVVRKITAVCRYFSQAMAHFMIFPLDSLRVLGIRLKSGMLSTLGLK